MNGKSILIWAMAIGTLSSCMSDGDVYDPEKIEAMKVAKYEAAFVKKYGKVDPKQDWGFGEAEAAMKAVTRGLWENANQWHEKLIIPAEITVEERNRVLEAFKEPINSPQSIDIKMSDFFVQQVYLNETPYMAKDGQNSKTVGGYINNIMYGSSSAGGNNGKLKENTIKRNNVDVKENIVFFQNEAWGGKFNFHCSEGNLNLGESNYVIKRIGDYYYLGFDFQTNGSNANQIVERDNIYNDIILKIVPAEYIGTHRIMAEDLAVEAGSDFDFNDVVFDAVIRTEYVQDPTTWQGENVNFAIITLRAAGGTIPLYIGERNEAHEVHHLFGVDTKTMVNTNKGAREEKEVAIFRLKGINSLSEIPIYVSDSTKPLDAIAGTAPTKLCCPTTYEWTDERQKIEDRYGNFKNAVSDGTELWYEEKTIDW